MSSCGEPDGRKTSQAEVEFPLPKTREGGGSLGRGPGNPPAITPAHNSVENITDWALEQFRDRYGDRSITKWDIFHYIYAVLHHPEYRQRYAANLRRELPRIPFAGATGAKAQIKGDADSALKRRSSTNAPSPVAGTANPESSARATVEERPFRAASANENDSRALAPEESLKGDGLGRPEDAPDNAAG